MFTEETWVCRGAPCSNTHDLRPSAFRNNAFVPFKSSRPARYLPTVNIEIVANPTMSSAAHPGLVAGTAGGFVQTLVGHEDPEHIESPTALHCSSVPVAVQLT
jgi:hypothetical protein